MKPQRCSAVVGLAAALFALHLLLPARAGAVQVFIESSFVHVKNAQCVMEVINGAPRYRCPPITYSHFPAISGGASVDRVSDPCGGAAIASCQNVCFPDNQVGAGVAFNFVVPVCTADGSGVFHCPGRCPSLGPCSPDLPNCNPNPMPGGNPAGNQYGNISDDPHIEFNSLEAANTCFTKLKQFQTGQDPLPKGETANNICNADLFMCAAVGYGNDDTTGTTPVAIDSMEFDVFRFLSGTNPLSDNTPTVHTYFVDAPGSIPAAADSTTAGPMGPFCILWDGSFNIQGNIGKTNGTFGFIAKVNTNQVGSSGNIQITAQRAYPSGTTFDAFNYGVGNSFGRNLTQQPVIVDVVDVHLARSTPTLYGSITPVPGEPYNIFYQLSKDATMYLNIFQPPDPALPVLNPTLVRTILPGVARVGEGIPTQQGQIVGPVFNGDSWNGRADNGDLLPPGVYLATLQAFSRDQYGDDLSKATTIQIGLDPLQITDIRVTPLAEQSTSQAAVTYLLTQPATAYVDIYPPGVQFCPIAGVGPPLNNVAATGLDPVNVPGCTTTKCFNASLGDCGAGFIQASPVKRFAVQQNRNVSVQSIWDGRDGNGALVPDGNYVFVVYAALASQNGFKYNNLATDKRIWTAQAKSGFLVVDRGYVGISQVATSFLPFGSSPTIGGVNPYQFSYSLSRDAIVNMTIFDASGLVPIKHLIVNETRPGSNILNKENWPDATDDNGQWVSSGTYMIQLTATDPAFPTKVSTTTAMFPVTPYHIADVSVAPILGGASDFVTVTYTPSQSSLVYLNIYPPGTVVLNSSGTWPPCNDPAGSPCGQVLTAPPSVAGSHPANLVFQISGLRLGRARITESWDGRDVNGVAVPDGQYVYTLIAQSTTTPTHFMVERVIGTLLVNRGLIQITPFQIVPDVPTLFASSSSITLPPFNINYGVTRQSSMTISILTAAAVPQTVRSIISGQLRNSGVSLSEVWDGRDSNGNFPPPGAYLVRATAVDVAAALSLPATAQTTIAFDPLRIFDVAAAPVQLGAGAAFVYQVSEPMKVAVKVYRPGTNFDANLNPVPPDNISLVKRIVAVHPARTQITDTWDGTDLTHTLVPDGTYKYKIVGSTDPSAIDNVTGNVLNPSALAEDRIVNDIPVIRNGSEDPEGDFHRNTFVYPNPVTQPSATISIYSPFQADVQMRIYNIAGSLVLEQDFGPQAPSWQSGNVTYTWNRTNQSGKTVARGIYYLVVRISENLGGKNVLQTVKKILIP